MKAKWNKVKETAGVIYMIVVLYVGIYYTCKWLFGGIFLVCNWIYDKINDRKKKKEIPEELENDHDQPIEDFEQRYKEYDKIIEESAFDDIFKGLFEK